MPVGRLKNVVEIGYDSEKVRLRRRLGNLFVLLLLVVRHLES